MPILGARRGLWYTGKRAPVGTAPAYVTDARTSQSRRALDTPGRDLEKVEGESPADGEPGAYVTSSRLDRGLFFLVRTLSCTLQKSARAACGIIKA